ncbi:hypothetical protein GCM10025768_02960 [Microbacterium pseudoresistens]|uniref:AB hydrolase-1 domain-containing protein n=1 Tax=Microbacterium pseudoresistens TaxID=640634 RepID=A0A7Y9EUD6_9MICO|nr:alpha/beta fold hydrolase [Microbacterium pseudoresistens]NYD54132.1 hypothetical protein [Microbacterium pseudoresistens]
MDDTTTPEQRPAMSTATSADGTPIAFSATGSGPTVVIVNGALSVAADAAPLAQGLRDAGMRAVVWDRRARGGSGDRAGSTPDDEIADLAAVIDAVGGADAVLGHSSGAVLALAAAVADVATGALFLSEPPIDFDGTGFDSDFVERLQGLVDDGRDADAVAAFQRDAVGLPAEMVEAARASGQLDALAPLAQSVVYDARLTLRMRQAKPAQVSPRARMVVIRGEQTFPFLVAAADRLADVVPEAELVIDPASAMHRPDPVSTARIIADRL